jgi:alkanesulfonate monooxygenase SsuD/methylene tetrahydromethanopterin reductase-like flavin-dependent oxidoreductase (luciferase family)
LLDLVSDGRVELGTGESSSEAELGGFRIDPADKRGMWEESLRVAVRCMTEAPFTGFAGQFVTMPPRNVVPKPLQRPHPPLWVACSRRDTILLAARRGLGALSFSFADPEEARGWVDEYYALLDSECVPVGDAVNANVSCTTLFMCAPTPEEAIRRGVENANFFGYSSAHYYVFGTHEPGTTDIWREFESGASERGFSTEAVIAEAQRTERLFAKAAGASGGLRGAIGSPDQIREYCERYEEMGVDQLAFIAQAGRSCHEDIMESIELFGTQVLPEIHARDVDLEAAKRDRLAPVIARALARKGADDHPPLPVPDYSFDAIPLAVATGSAGSNEYVTWLRDMQARRRRGEAVSIPDAAFSGVDVVPELDRLSSDRGDG